MPARTAQEMLDAYTEAEFQLSTGVIASYSVSGRTFTYADLDQVSSLRRYWEGRVAEQSRGFTTRADMRGDCG